MSRCMRKLKLELVYDLESVDPVVLLGRIIEILGESGLGNSQWLMYGTEVPEEGLVASYKRTGRRGFLMSNALVQIHYNSLPMNEIDLLSLEGVETMSASPSDIIGALSKEGRFVMAWIANITYEYWQNADRPDEYESAGKRYDHLPMISNGLPFPLEKKVIDITGNPGRRVLSCGQVEAVGSEMWLGEKFLKMNGLSRQGVLESDLFEEVRSFRDDGIYIRVQQNPFVSDGGLERDRQERLRKTLYLSRSPVRRKNDD